MNIQEQDSIYNNELISPRKGSCVNINFSDISYSVNSWTVNRFPFRRERKEILKGISGDFQASELTGIIGPSGSGKSSLLDILSGYSLEFSGQVLHNGASRDLQQFRKQVAYIMQDCRLQPLITVKEAMVSAAQLKLGRLYSFKQKMTIVMDILAALKLTHKTESLTQTLSGGEMKRLAIALELVNNPPVMFFDEPTSGLDYHTAKKCLHQLKQLAVAGYNVVCTLHQPSASMFEQLDHVYVLAGGRCTYQGGTKGLTAFLGELSLSCPEYHNPADHVLDVSVGEYGPCTDRLVDKISNGKSRDWRRSVLTSDTEDTERCNQSTSVQKTDDEQYPAPFSAQVYVLLLRTIAKIHRDKFLTYLRFCIHCTVGSLLGLFYYGIGSDAAYIFDNFSLLFFSLMFLMFTAFSSMIMSIPLEMPIIVREHFNRWYSLKAYYMATTIAETPVQVLCTLAYCCIVYVVSKQPPELFRFGLFLLMCTVITLLTQAVGVLVGCSLSIKHGVVFGPLAIMPWVIFSGFFLHISDAPSPLQWLFHISYLKYGLEGLMLAIYGYDRGRIACSDDYCHFRKPSKFLKEMDMSDASYILALGVVVSMYLVIKVVTFYMLRYQLSHRR
ncbi:ATP-binding cassette sub-family G member 1-like isoform X2 [Homalodisca vitripennis]|uniref:ATP-binding cassette sub-family G member 1-like isoform X2 n=1 Tax=Homalodisca vitripennis TaxID=197043 RepID=UPI001EEB65F6|nr:ATP-binding cassette sub-family G member 1-like isoform X2 [Homalodisca vitripennis]